MKLSGAKNYKNYSLKLLSVCKKKPISFEVFADTHDQMLKQAEIINSWGKNVYVKIPVVNSKGLYSAVGTCFSAAAWITISTPFNAVLSLSLFLTSPKKYLKNGYFL